MLPVVLLSFENERVTEYQSPNELNTLVIRDSSFLLSGAADLYEKRNFLVIKKLDVHLSCDDGCYPDVIGSTWISENTVELYYFNGNGYSTITIVLGD